MMPAEQFQGALLVHELDHQGFSLGILGELDLLDGRSLVFGQGRGCLRFGATVFTPFDEIPDVGERHTVELADHIIGRLLCPLRTILHVFKIIEVVVFLQKRNRL